MKLILNKYPTEDGMQFKYKVYPEEGYGSLLGQLQDRMDKARNAARYARYATKYPEIVAKLAAGFGKKT